MTAKRIKRRKPPALRKDDQIRVLVSAADKARLTAAATARGLGVATWVRSAALAEADRILRGK